MNVDNDYYSRPDVKRHKWSLNVPRDFYDICGCGQRSLNDILF
jgi:hypothetical protein